MDEVERSVRPRRDGEHWPCRWQPSAGSALLLGTMSVRLHADVIDGSVPRASPRRRQTRATHRRTIASSGGAAWLLMYNTSSPGEAPFGEESAQTRKRVMRNRRRPHDDCTPVGNATRGAIAPALAIIDPGRATNSPHDLRQRAMMTRPSVEACSSTPRRTFSPCRTETALAMSRALPRRCARPAASR